MKYTIPSFILVLAMISCNNVEKEKILHKREKDLAEREALLSKKEALFQSLLKMRDSIQSVSQKDSTQTSILPSELLGEWSSKIICYETNCPEYAIGDNRVESWFFTNDSLGSYVKSIHNKQERLYSVQSNDRQILLNYSSVPAPNRKVNVNINLNEISPNKIKGTKIISLEDGKCNSKFSVELTKTQKL